MMYIIINFKNSNLT